MSFTVSAKPISWEKFAKKMKFLDDSSQKNVAEALGKSALLVHSTAIKSIQKHESSGIKYGNHTASKPGNPPNSDTGDLVKSIGFEVDMQNLTAKVGTGLLYGAHLEFGTRNIAPRPWLLPAFRENVDKMAKLIRQAFAAAVKEAK